LPNEAIRQDVSLDEFKVTLEKVERAAGIVFNSSQQVIKQ
jgi:hypothetical protein